MKRWWTRIMWVVLAAVIVAALVYALLPQPVEVDISSIERAPMRVTVDEDGETRVRERYIVSAPLAGQLRRITLDPGDPVTADETTLATIVPPDPSLLDPRTQAEAEARVQAAEAAQQQAQANMQRAEAQLELANNDLARIEQLFQRNAATSKELDDARLLARVREQEYEAAQWARQVAEHELALARAALLRTQPDGGPEAARALPIVSPVTGEVLRVMRESAAVVQAGENLIEVGDPDALEVVIDVLSQDAVRIEPGDAVVFEGWGGEAALHGLVRRVEPSAFTEVSALGVEEQRVNVIIDIDEPSDQRLSLGDAYRMDARIIVWQEDRVLQAPTSALFREGDRWAVFVVEDGRAVVRRIEIGRQTAETTQVLDGLREGETVVLYPSDQLASGVAVTPRDTNEPTE